MICLWGFGCVEKGLSVDEKKTQPFRAEMNFRGFDGLMCCFILAV